MLERTLPKVTTKKGKPNGLPFGAFASARYGTVEPRPNRKAAIAKMRNTTKKIHAISDATYSTRNNPNRPAIKAINRNNIAARNMVASFGKKEHSFGTG
jgi:hypothetical protein